MPMAPSLAPPVLFSTNPHFGWKHPSSFATGDKINQRSCLWRRAITHYPQLTSDGRKVGRERKDRRDKRKKKWEEREEKSKREERGEKGGEGRREEEGGELEVIEYLPCGPCRLPGTGISLAVEFRYFFHSRYISLPCFEAGRAGLTNGLAMKHLVPGSISA